MALNLFDNIFNQFTKQAQQQVPSFAAPQAPRTTNYTQPIVTPAKRNTTGFAPGFEGTVDESKNLFNRIMTPVETGVRALSQNIQKGGQQLSDIAMKQSENAIDRGYNQGYINLGKKIKEKHPQYADISDEELGRKIVSKYPQYQDIVDEGSSIMSNPISGTAASIESGLSKGFGTMFSGISALGSAPLQDTGTAGVTRFAKGAMETGLGSAQIATSVMPTAMGAKALIAPTVNTLFSTDTAGKVLSPITEGIGTGIGMGQEALGFDPNSSVSKDIQNIGSTAGTIALLGGAQKGGAKLYEGAKTAGGIIKRGSEAAAPSVSKGAKIGADVVSSPFKSVINTAKKYVGNPEEISGIQSAIKPKQRVKNGVVQRSQDAINKEITLTNSLIRESGTKPVDLETYKNAIKGEMEKIGSEINRLTGQDLTIDITPSTAKLRQLANSDIVKTLDPADTNALLGLADRLDANGGRMSLSMAEEMNQWLNSVLKDTTVPKSEAYKRGLVSLVGDIRDGLDNAISTIPGQFKDIKKAYGALRNVYGDTVAREIVFNRQNMGGLVDSIGAIEGAGNIVSGGGKILMGDVRSGVADIGRGIASNAMGRFIKSKNDPNNIIRTIFEKGGNKSTLPNIPNKPTNGTPLGNSTNSSPVLDMGTAKKVQGEVKKPKSKPIVKPNTIKNESKVIKPTTGDTIPEGYTKNSFGEIIKKPNNKTGGFIKIPEIGKKSEGIERMNPFGNNPYKSGDFAPLKDLDSDALFRAIGTKDWENIPKQVTLYRGIKSNKDFELFSGDFLTKNKKIAENFAGKEGKVKAFKVNTEDLQGSDFGYEEVIYKPKSIPVKNPLVKPKK